MRALLALVLWLAPGAAWAEMDAPVTTETVMPKSEADPIGEIRCTYYADFMVRETNTASPAPGRSRIVPVTGNHPACATAAGVVDPEGGPGLLGDDRPGAASPAGHVGASSTDPGLRRRIPRGQGSGRRSQRHHLRGGHEDRHGREDAGHLARAGGVLAAAVAPGRASSVRLDALHTVRYGSGALYLASPEVRA